MNNAHPLKINITSKNVGHPMVRHLLFSRLRVLLVVAFAIGLTLTSDVLSQQSQTQPRIKSVSTRGVARIHDRDFPNNGRGVTSQTATVKANKGRSQPLSPLPTSASGFQPSASSKDLDSTFPKIQMPVPKNGLDGTSLNSSVESESNQLSDKRASGSGATGDSISENVIPQIKSDPRENAEPQNKAIENAPSELADQDFDETEEEQDEGQTSSFSFGQMTDRKSLPGTIQMFVSIAAISLVPAILLMTTCFIRIVVVLGILRQAIGLQQLPPTQVTTGLALMMTFLVMAPTWKEVKQNAIDPYTAEGSTMSWDEAWDEGVTPVKKFMWSQIRRAENENDFWIFYDYLPEEEKSKEPTSFRDVPLKVLLPAFMISELKVAFLIGIQILLPFLILDIVVASLCNTMGLIMLPPAVVSLPLKLLLFVMVDGWNLVVSMLLNSFALIQA